MAQGDITLFDWAPHTLLSDLTSGSVLYGWMITNKKVAEYDDDNPKISDYERISGIPVINFGVQVFYSSSSGVASLKSYSKLMEPMPDVANADRVFQIILGNSETKLLAFMDVTDDGGVTPWNLKKVPMRITFPTVDGVTNVVFNVEGE